MEANGLAMATGQTLAIWQARLNGWPIAQIRDEIARDVPEARLVDIIDRADRLAQDSRDERRKAARLEIERWLATI